MVTVAPSFSRPLRCRLMGRAPIAHPPGSDTRAWPKRATRGPRTSTEARICFTSSYGARGLSSLRAWISTRLPYSSCSIDESTPSSSSRLRKVPMSRTRGTLRRITRWSVSRAAAIAGSAAFFAPWLAREKLDGLLPGEFLCQHQKRHRQAPPGFFKRARRRRRTGSRGLYEDILPPLAQLLVRQLHVDHQVRENAAQAHHGGGGEHV